MNRLTNTCTYTLVHIDEYAAVHLDVYILFVCLIRCPYDALSFCCCFENGRVELWNFGEQKTDPVAYIYPNAAKNSRCTKINKIWYDVHIIVKDIQSA